MAPHGPGFEWQDELPIQGTRCATPGEKKLIAGVKVKRLPALPDERGVLTEILRSDDPEHSQFGQVYMTTTYPGVVKAWHYHEKQTDMVCCVSGELKLALYDGRVDSPTQGIVNEIFCGDSNRVIVKVPAGIHHGWKCVGEHTALIINLPDRVYRYDAPDEHRTDPHENDIPYDWRRRDG
ncbi:MAG: dTDP-4-dehydrorhamnose 3,5-epimerase family protein [Armatimonadetes bacterium]|nr:dTDP-4-dehydrorhamnose 3,5-epimerase family protein [Armatimonadota bacterium]